MGKVESLGYLMIGMNGEHSKVWDTVLSILIYLTDPDKKLIQVHQCHQVFGDFVSLICT